MNIFPIFDKMINFDNIKYLQEGNDVQRKVFNIVSHSYIIQSLKNYSPIIVGSIPINVNIKESDIDIICHYTNKVEFKNTLITLFNKREEFIITEFLNYGIETVTSNFKIDGFEIEVFGQNVPTKEQLAYRHLLIEHKLLLQYGEPLRMYVVDQKLKGSKTEPAFCNWLGIEGNPYLEILKLESKY
jgi:hypothetical protein